MSNVYHKLAQCDVIKQIIWLDQLPTIKKLWTLIPDALINKSLDILY